jgi:hypothetical protein
MSPDERDDKLGFDPEEESFTPEPQEGYLEKFEEDLDKLTEWQRRDMMYGTFKPQEGFKGFTDATGLEIKHHDRGKISFEHRRREDPFAELKASLPVVNLGLELRVLELEQQKQDLQKRIEVLLAAGKDLAEDASMYNLSNNGHYDTHWCRSCNAEARWEDPMEPIRHKKTCSVLVFNEEALSETS